MKKKGQSRISLPLSLQQRATWQPQLYDIEECRRCGKARYIGQTEWNKHMNTNGRAVKRVVCEQCR